MNVAVAAPPTQTAAEAVRYHRFTVDQYHRMIDLGIFKPDVRVELFKGWIVRKMTHKPPHDSAVARLTRRLYRLLSEEWSVRVQSAITLKDSEPEPDIVIAIGSEETYDRRHPGPKDIALLVEVADATVAYDRDAKGPLYAQARIAVYWIVNLVNRRVEVYTEPKTGRSPSYRTRRDFTVDESIPLVLDGSEIARIPVREILP